MAVDFVAVAESQVGDFYLNSFGMTVDFSPASLVELDAFMDEMWGTDAREPGWQPSQGQWAVIVNFGAYTGEVIRRRLGGTWALAEGMHVAHAVIHFANDWNVLPINKALKRMRDGAADALHPLWELATQHAGVQIDRARVAAEYTAHAAAFPGKSHLPAEGKAEVVARLQAQVQLRPGTMLAACPACKRPASPGRIACVYCGGALIVPATCGACGRKNNPKAKACMFCRAAL